jgi:hypothetical protein
MKPESREEKEEEEGRRLLDAIEAYALWTFVQQFNLSREDAVELIDNYEELVERDTLIAASQVAETVKRWMRNPAAQNDARTMDYRNFDTHTRSQYSVMAIRKLEAGLLYVTDDSQIVLSHGYALADEEATIADSYGAGKELAERIRILARNAFIRQFEWQDTDYLQLHLQQLRALVVLNEGVYQAHLSRDEKYISVKLLEELHRELLDMYKNGETLPES